MKKFLLYMIPAVCAVLGTFLAVVYHNTGKTNRTHIVCTEVDVVVTDSLLNSFILAEDVKKFLTDEYGECIGMPVDSIDLSSIEDILDSKSAVLKHMSRETEGSISR